MEEHPLVWLPRNYNQSKINGKGKQNIDKFQLGQPKGNSIWNPFFSSDDLSTNLEVLRSCPELEVEVMEVVGPGEEEIRAGTKRTRLFQQSWVLWLSTCVESLEDFSSCLKWISASSARTPICSLTKTFQAASGAYSIRLTIIPGIMSKRCFLTESIQERESYGFKRGDKLGTLFQAGFRVNIAMVVVDLICLFQEFKSKFKPRMHVGKGGPKSTLNENDGHVIELPEQISNENKHLLCTAENCPIDRRSGEALCTAESCPIDRRRSGEALCTAESCPIDIRRSGEAHLSEMKTKGMSEEESQKYWKLKSNSKRKLSRSQSIHHLEDSYYLENNGEIPGQKTPINFTASGMKSNSLNAMDTEDYIIQRKISIRSTSVTEKSNEVKKTLETNQIKRNISSRSFKEDVHIQEIFKANRKLFAELLQGAHGKHTLQTRKNTKSSASLAKSMSFPAPGLAPKGYKKLSSLQHKQIESFPKVIKTVTVSQQSKLVESESPKLFHEDVTPRDSDSTSSQNIRQQASSSSWGPNRGLKHGGWNQLVIKRFNFIKQKIRHSFKERKKGHNQKTSKRIPTVDPSGHELPLYREEAQGSVGTATSEDRSGIREYSETESSENDNLSNGVQTKTGTASLNASLERYSQLSEYGSNRNREGKCYHSHSLKLTSEDKIPKTEKPPKPSGRNLSMPDIDLFCTLFTDPPPVLRTQKTKRGLVHSSSDNNIRTDENPALLLNTDISEPMASISRGMVEKSHDDNRPVNSSVSLNCVEKEDGIVWADELEEKLPHLDISDGKHHEVMGSECRVQDVSEFSHNNQVLELQVSFHDDETLKLSNSEGATLNHVYSIANELEPFDDQRSEASTELLPAFEIIVNHEFIDDADKISNYLYLQSESDRINNADFNYMRYILQLSSFIESGHTIDRPLSPSKFDGEEAHFYKKLECYWKKVDKDSDHQLLLDLVYETLHDVFERSFISFLKTFSSKSQIRPMPLGQYLLEEVRIKVAWYLCLGPELDQSLDDVVGRDLRKGDDWMNLQSETEYIALELEDLILDELLDEVLSF